MFPFYFHERLESAVTSFDSTPIGSIQYLCSMPWIQVNRISFRRLDSPQETRNPRTMQVFRGFLVVVMPESSAVG